MKVKAAPGLQCPKEDNPREYIGDDDKGQDVPDTTYYRRLLDDGSLVLVPAKTKGGDQ
jgi:hypothetical protein